MEKLNRVRKKPRGKGQNGRQVSMKKRLKENEDQQDY
jgi:hypothetical protein